VIDRLHPNDRAGFEDMLLNAVNRASLEHTCAREWLEGASSAPADVGLTWIVLIGFIRLSSRRRTLAKPLDMDHAFTVVEHWTTNPAARILHPTARHGAIPRRLLVAAATAGNLTTDAHLAALAIEHGGTVASFDHDFERFPSVDFELPRA
jgi:toxin-antitoxin system PIN domain toxin